MRRPRLAAPLLAAFALIVSGCGSAPPAGTPERAAWDKAKQEEVSGAERSGQRNDVSDPVPVPVVK